MAARSLSHLAVHLGVTLGLAAATVTAVGVATQVGADGAASSFVPITPCRLMDTRPAPDNVGARNTSIGAGQTYDALVWGTNGNCTIPTTATAVSMNVTAINPTASSFLTVYPSDAAKPLAASLNWVAGQAPTPNAVTTTLSSAGRVSFFNLSGSVDLTADIVGYYQPADLPVPGPQGPAGPTGAAGATGATGATGPAGGANRLTPAQIGMKRWDQDPGRRALLLMNGNPTSLAFDGSSIWVTRRLGHTVERIDPASSTVVASVDVGAAQPEAITWGAGRIWVATTSPNALVRINPALNAVTATIPLSTAPNAVAYDGTRVLVANSDGTVTRVNPTNNTVIDSFQIPGAGSLSAIIWDGTSAWAADFTLGAVHRLDTSIPATVGTPIATGGTPLDLAFDGTSIWVANSVSGTVTRIDPNAPGFPNGGAGDVTGTISGLNSVRRLAYDGTFLRVGQLGGTVRRVNTTTMTVTATWTVGGSIGDVLYDGTNLWVVVPTSGSVFKEVLF